MCLFIGLSALALQSGSNPDRSRFDPVRTRHAKIVTGSNPDSLDPHTGGSFNWIQLDRSGIIVGAVPVMGQLAFTRAFAAYFSVRDGGWLEF